MDVIRVEFQKRDSGILWITVKAEDGGIEVYPMHTRDIAALRDFLNDPSKSELIIRDNFAPWTKDANYCDKLGHGFNYSGNCPDCPKCDYCGQTEKSHNSQTHTYGNPPF